MKLYAKFCIQAVHIIHILSSCIYRSLYFKKNIEPKLPALHQMAEGLKWRGLLHEIRTLPNVFYNCFVVNCNELSLEVFFDLLHVEYSPEGSNKQSKEVDVYKYFCDFMEYCYHDGK